MKLSKQFSVKNLSAQITKKNIFSEILFVVFFFLTASRTATTSWEKMNKIKFAQLKVLKKGKNNRESKIERNLSDKKN